jgi:PhnB protein
MQLEPYLFFSGNCEEALNFYKSIFNGEITHISRFKDMPSNGQGATPPDYANKIMHATFTSEAFTLMASDGRPSTQYGEGRISLSLGLSDLAQAQRIFDGLAKGGNVEVPLSDSFWGAKFGMLTDRFGIDWMINCQVAQPAR